MGKKQTRAGKYFYFYIASLIFIPLLGCSIMAKPVERVVEVPRVPPMEIEKLQVQAPPPEVPKEEEEKAEAYEYLLDGEKLLLAGKYEDSLKKIQKALSLSANQPPGDEALFNMGLIYAHFGNPNKNYEKSLNYFKKLMKDYPLSPLVAQAKIWTVVLQENRELSQMIEKSKQVDIEIEEKKREKVR